MGSNIRKEVMMLLAAGVLLALLPLAADEFYLYVIRLIIIYAIAALGLNIFMGFTGQINIGSAGFFCIGAYFPTMLQVKLGLHYGLAFPASIIACLIVAWGMSYPLLRLRGHAMAIGTLSFAMAIDLIAERFPSLSGGADGIIVPKMDLFGQTMGNLFYYYLLLVFGILVYLICCLLVDSRIGRAFRAIRDDDAAASAMGIHVDHYKRLAWVINGVLCGVAGSLYAQQAGFLSPATFSLWTNMMVLVMIVVGGLGTNLGSVVGAAIMTALPYFLVTIQNYILLVQGLVLFTFLRFLPYGVVGALAKRHGRAG